MAPDVPDTSTPATATLGQDNSRRPGRLRLAVIEGPGKGLTHELSRQVVTIGRNQMADITLDDPSISGLHAEVRLGFPTVDLRDLGSHNGTMLNGRKIVQVEIEAGDEIRVGSSLLEVLGVDDVGVDLYPRDSFGEVLGHSRVMRELFARLAKLAPSSMDVLITGETGTGKEVVARSLHDASGRRGRPFVVLNCGCLPPTLAESALFGHIRGAFTGAACDQEGAFEQANGGTIFIDEIGDLPLQQQVKLLRVLDRREYSRVGESRLRTLDIRVISATHRDLRAQIENESFREDLYYRLARAQVELPPLRHRGDDVELLARSFLGGRPTRMTLDDSARLALREHPWHGNVRELRSVVEHAACFAKDNIIRRGDLALREHRDRTTKIDEVLRTGSYHEVHDAIDRWLLPKVLEEHKGVLTHAAGYLEISPKGLRERLKRLNLFRVKDEPE